MMNIRRYTAEDSNVWDDFVRKSKNGTFLLLRQFMDYHSDRFEDHSLIVSKGKNIVCLLPANYDERSKTLFSHQGLTYGGLIMSRKTSCKQVIEAMSLIKQHCKEQLHAQRIIYKCIPSIYTKYPSEEGLYALFKNNGLLISRSISSCIDLTQRIPFTESRKSGIRKAVDIVIQRTDDTQTFWNILYEVLTTRHGTTPVHSPEEMSMLMKRFPHSIALYGAYDQKGTMLAGAFIFDCGEVVHTQYLAASAEGKRQGALDRLIACLIEEEYRNSHYLDFGISTENQGRILNEGLLFQKEGFGGRGICYDQYEINI